MKAYFIALFLILFFLSSCSEKKRFIDTDSDKTKVDFSNQLTNTSELNILKYLYFYNGAGVAAADFNNDGFIDLYFTGNQVSDELFLNKGNLVFQKITTKAGIENNTGWTTGVTHVDINSDGLLDIYVCKASGYRSLKGQNLLFVNKGNDVNGIPQFVEESKKYGLNFSGLSTQAAFFDYDLDGDLDMYLMNHSVHPNRTYGKGKQRRTYDSISGDILFQNQNNFFVDVSKTAGIFQGKSGYGLGLSVGDLNNDAYPDIYIGNDFYENDYLYFNQKDGTFKEVISSENSKLGHTTHFSMGNVIGDINNDNFQDIVSLDMLPENIETYKSSGLEYPYPIYQQYLKNGYSPQYMQNTLHLNLGDEKFAEIGNLAQISATEWSWCVLMADFDNDKFNDLYITNGIKGATNDMDYINFISDGKIQKRLDGKMNDDDMHLITTIPEKKVSNYFFSNKGNLSFQNVTSSWYNKKPSFSNGSTYADLDNDGDLDIIVNNINEMADILENKSTGANYLKLKLKGPLLNPFGVGVKIEAYCKKEVLSRENYATKGYLSATSNILHLGLGTDSIIDSLKINWSNSKVEIKRNLKSNQLITIHYEDATTVNINPIPKEAWFEKIDSVINFKHKENNSLDFDRQPLIPYALSNQGPDIQVADINNDGLHDLFISGAKKQASELFLQKSNGEFQSVQKNTFEGNSIDENTSSIFFDANGDDYLDLLVVNGGNEFISGEALNPKLYLNINGTYIHDKTQFNTFEMNASKVATVDFDNNGTMDISISADAISTEFGKTPIQYLFKNNGNGNFNEITASFAPEFRNIGNITDHIWIDIDKNGYQDLIAVGHWMPVSIFLNDGKSLKLQENNNGLKNTNGLWNTIKAADFDNDGDIDFVCGNWGLNTKFKASEKEPMTLYRNDFDDNQTSESIITYYNNKKEILFASKDELAKQIPSINKKFLSYNEFAKASPKELLTSQKLNDAEQKKVHVLQSVYFENTGSESFITHDLPRISQSSALFDFAIDDFNNDGYKDLMAVGNIFEISTQLGRLDALHGIILLNDKNGNFVWDHTQNLNIFGAFRTIQKINVKNKPSYILGRNNDSPILISKKNNIP